MENAEKIQPIFSPSLMCLDFLEIRDQVKILNRYCDMLHADIMDGHFVKNISLSVDIIKAIQSIAELPIETHLMVTDPNNYIEALAKIGVDTISLHAEVIQTYSYRIIHRIKALGCRVGIVLCPATPLSLSDWYLNQVDLLTIMTVEPGFSGQKFIPRMVEKVAEASRLKAEKGYHYQIQVDGAIGPKTFKDLYDAGARVFVMDSSGLFMPGTDLETNCQNMKKTFTSATGLAF